LTLIGKQILRTVNIDIWEDHVHAIIGLNDAGKSTFVSSFMGFWRTTVIKRERLCSRNQRLMIYVQLKGQEKI